MFFFSARLAAELMKASPSTKRVVYLVILFDVSTVDPRRIGGGGGFGSYPMV